MASIQLNADTPRRATPLPAVVARHPLAALIAAALAVRIALTPLYAHLPNGLLDEGFWKHWMERIHQHGVLNIFRSSDTDYVGYHWVLWLLSLVYDGIGGPYTQTTPSLHILVKMPSIAFDVVLILTVYHATRVLLRETTATANQHAAQPHLPLIAAAVIAFQPAVLYDSAVWAQTDSAITAAMLGAIVLAHSARPAWAGVAYALGFAIKPHPIIVAPLLLLALLRHGRLRAIAIAAGGAVLVAALVLGPWVLHGDARRILDVYRELFGPERQRLSELAWNYGWMIDYRHNPGGESAVFGWAPWFTYRVLGLTLSSISAALALTYVVPRPGLASTLVAGAYQAFAFYALPVGAHERYLYPFLALLLPVALLDRRWLWLYVPVSATFFLNLFVVAPPVPDWMDRWVYSGFGVAVAGVNMTLFAAFTCVLAAGAVSASARRDDP